MEKKSLINTLKTTKKANLVSSKPSSEPVRKTSKSPIFKGSKLLKRPTG